MPKADDRIHNASLPFASSPPFHIIEEREKKGFSKTASIRPMGDIFTPGIISRQ